MSILDMALLSCMSTVVQSQNSSEQDAREAKAQLQATAWHVGQRFDPVSAFGAGSAALKPTRLAAASTSTSYVTLQFDTS